MGKQRSNPEPPQLMGVQDINSLDADIEDATLVYLVERIV